MNYSQEPYLSHYGVLGMKWGVRHDKQYRAQKKNLKSEYKQRNRKIQNDYDKIESSIDSKYKAGQRLSDSDYAKQVDAAAKMGKQWDASKKKYKSDLAKLKSETANRLYPKNSKKGLSKNQKTALKIGAALIGGAALAYGGYKLSKAHAGQTAIKAAQSILRKQGHTNLKSIAIPSYRVNVKNYDLGLNTPVYTTSRSKAKAIAKNAPGITRVQKGHMVSTYIPGEEGDWDERFISTHPGSLKGMVNYLRTH